MGFVTFGPLLEGLQVAKHEAKHTSSFLGDLVDIVNSSISHFFLMRGNNTRKHLSKTSSAALICYLIRCFL